MGAAIICGSGPSLKYLGKIDATYYCCNAAIYARDEWDYQVITDGFIPLSNLWKERHRVKTMILANRDDWDRKVQGK